MPYITTMKQLANALTDIIQHPLQVSLCHPNRIAEFRVELDYSGAASRAEQQQLLVRAEEAFSQLSWVRKSIVVYPYVYIDICTDAFSALLCEEVRETGSSGRLSDFGRNELCNVSCCSPNANKPLHLGHARNLTIGGALAPILRAAGYRVQMTASFSDYGSHIARAVSAFCEDGCSKSPENTGVKGDHLIGRFYSEGSRRSQESGPDSDRLRELEERLLREYMDGNAVTVRLFEQLTSWATAGIRLTFERFGCHFDRFIKETETIPCCRKIINDGLTAGTIVRREDGSMWVAGLPAEDRPILVRSNGTYLFLLQSLASAVHRYGVFGEPLRVYITIRADEQQAVFNLYRRTWAALGFEEEKSRFIVSYGLVFDGDRRIRSRAGSDLTLDGLLDELNAHFATVLGEQTQTAERLIPLLSEGTLKSYLLSHPLKKRLHFSRDDLVHGRGRFFLSSCFVLQRAYRLLAGETGREPAETRRHSLLRTICRLDEVVLSCAQRRDPTPMMQALRQLIEQGSSYLGGRGNIVGTVDEVTMFVKVVEWVFSLLNLPLLSPELLRQLPTQADLALVRADGSSIEDAGGARVEH